MCRTSEWDLERHQFYQVLSLSESAGRIRTKNKKAKLLGSAKNKRISEESGLAFWWVEKNSRLKTWSLCLRSSPVSRADRKFFPSKIKDKNLSPFTLPDHGHSPTYLFFFSFFIFLFSLRLFCAAFLFSFTPLLFSFITPSSFESFYVWVLPSYKKRENDHPNFYRFSLSALCEGVAKKW